MAQGRFVTQRPSISRSQSSLFLLRHVAVFCDSRVMLFTYKAIGPENRDGKMRSDLVGHRLKLQHLKVVMAVAEWGSMQKAAKQLAISQPVVSKVVAEVETLLGVPLFDRS